MTVVSDYRALLYGPSSDSSWRWNGMTDRGSPVFVTYSFAEGSEIPTLAEHNPFGASSYSAMSAQLRQNVRLAMAEFEKVTGVKFIEVDSGGMMEMFSASGAGGFSWALIYGDVGYNRSGTGYLAMNDGYGGYAPGDWGFETILHELGHAMWLSHPHEGNVTLDPAVDNNHNTVMSYTRDSTPVSDLRYLDIDALQYLYGGRFDPAALGIGYHWNAATSQFSIAGGASNDVLIGVNFVNEIFGGAGDDRIFGRSANDILRGGDGNDFIGGGDGVNSMYGEAGNDRFQWLGWGNSLYDGGTGIDTIDASHLNFGANVYLDGSGGGIYASIENIVGSPYNDYFSGSSDDNVIQGAAGDDTFYASAGNDHLHGGQGSDVLIYRAYAAELDYLSYASEVFLVGRTGNGASYGLQTAAGIETFDFWDVNLTASSVPVFDALGYIASHADLIGAVGANGRAGTMHYLSNGMPEGRGITFDGLSYIASHADLIAALGSDHAAGAAHYIAGGFHEGRGITFDGYQYLASHIDLLQALGPNPVAAAEHYIDSGRAEGRGLSFEGLRYIASHSDLVQALGVDQAGGAKHFVQSGYAEGRQVTFDSFGYVASYDDLISAIGANSEAAAGHYIASGFSENREVRFEAGQYVSNYADLQGAFASDDAVAWHFINSGHAERRMWEDPLEYVASFADLIDAFAPFDMETIITNALSHFSGSGFTEGRRSGIDFNTDQYIANYSDLQMAFSDGMGGYYEEAATLHFIQSGYHEGRTDDVMMA